jgi:hypothetical protein
MSFVSLRASGDFKGEGQFPRNETRSLFQDYRIREILLLASFEAKRPILLYTNVHYCRWDSAKGVGGAAPVGDGDGETQGLHHQSVV